MNALKILLIGACFALVLAVPQYAAFGIIGLLAYVAISLDGKILDLRRENKLLSDRLTEAERKIDLLI